MYYPVILSSIAAFKGIMTPAVEVNGLYVPDLHSRYFTADFSYGLNIIKQIADFVHVYTPNINETLNWYKKIAVEKSEFRYGDYGITKKKISSRFIYSEKINPS